MSDEDRKKLREYSKNKYYSLLQEDSKKIKEYMKGYMK